jgi:hypothetical protein
MTRPCGCKLAQRGKHDPNTCTRPPPTSPCAGCERYIQSAGWRKDLLPEGAELSRAHAPGCREARKRKPRAETLQGRAELKGLVSPDVKARADALAEEHGLTLGEVQAAALASLEGRLVALPADERDQEIFALAGG